jgi:hypothetical protein
VVLGVVAGAFVVVTYVCGCGLAFFKLLPKVWVRYVQDGILYKIDLG